MQLFFVPVLILFAAEKGRKQSTSKLHLWSPATGCAVSTKNGWGKGISQSGVQCLALLTTSRNAQRAEPMKDRPREASHLRKTYVCLVMF